MGHYFTNENLESNIQEFKIKINNCDFTFKTDNGVFSKGELDFGTNLLIKNVLERKISGEVLDLGCGYGPIGITLAKILNCQMTMIDVNKRAVHLTKMNIKDNGVNNIEVLVSEGYNELKDKKFDYIVSNPPIRVGKQILYDLLIKAKDHLKENGEMYIVVRKEQGANSLIRDMSAYYQVEVIDKDKGFFIILLK